jgi:SPP1 gp7 family putative phage head morphogenesis protein
MPAVANSADPVQPAAPIRTEYQRRLERAVTDMHKSVRFWVAGCYRVQMANAPIVLAADAPPHHAGDASAPRELQDAIRKLSRRWLRNFDKLAWKLSDWFATKVEERSTVGLRESLRKHGFTVRFKPTRAMNDAAQAVAAENVALIKSIPEQYLKSVEGAVMRSAQTGRDLKSLVDELTQIEGITRRRAKLIARTQNNQATAAMTRVRMLEAGITQAIWVHTGAGRTFRPAHVAMSGRRYSIADGADVEGRWPGVAINCHCIQRPVIPGFD